MKHKLSCGVLAIALAGMLAAPASAGLTPYSQDFEGLDAMDTGALGADSWLVFGNVFNGANGNYLYGYGPFPAPNDGAAFSAIVSGEGGPPQGAQQLSVFSDYNNGDHGNGRFIEANVFQERIVSAADVDSTWLFEFDAKRGNIEGVTTALAFFKTLDPNAGFALTNFITVDMTGVTDAWTSHHLSIGIDAGLVGQILQFGYLNTATNYEGSAVYYDNVNFAGFITLCHLPPGNPDNGHTITVGLGSKDAHLAHGDFVGACRSTVDTEVTGVGETFNKPDVLGRDYVHDTPPVMHRRPKVKVGSSKPKLVDPSGR